MRGVSQLIKRKGQAIIKLIVILVTREQMIGCKVAIRGYVQFEARGVQGSEVTYCSSAAACVRRF